MIDAGILVVDDDQDILDTARMFLKGEFSEIFTERDPGRILHWITSRQVDIVLLDMNFHRGINDGAEGFYWLGRILEIDQEAIVILITAYGEVDLAVRAMKKGATDFILKPWKNQKLLGTMLSALELRKTRVEVKKLREANRNISSEWERHYGDFIGDSPQILRLKELVEKVAPTDANILISGENGTGKEVVARALHQQSLRAAQPFIRVDVGSLAESLFESEMFGHVKGAFTDAQQDKSGRFELADGGTLFLDEIGNLSLASQSKLLTALQNRMVTRLGSNRERKVDIRFICASNQSLEKMVEEGSFRQDLMYRLNTVELKIPPLRERTGDIEKLANFFLSKYREKYHKFQLAWSPAALKHLSAYIWPGNVRELQHAVERAVILCDDEVILAEDIPLDRSKATGPLAETLEENEKLFLLRKLDENDWNVSETARQLGITRTVLYRRLNKHGISKH